MAYEDRSIGVAQDPPTIRGYYFPGAVKRIPLSTIRSVRRADMATLRGRGRIWGTANPGYWANLDPGRPRKTVAFLVDIGRRSSRSSLPTTPRPSNRRSAITASR